MDALGATLGPPLVNETGVWLLKARVNAPAFTARPLEFGRSWPEPAHVPLERRWGLLGVGLCPMPREPRRRPRRKNETSLMSCLAACSATPRCRSASFSQRRSRCLLSRGFCDPDDLTMHSSYATFAPTDVVESLIRRTRVEAGEGPGEPLRVYASATSRLGPMVNAFVSSLHAAGDRVTLLLHHGSDRVQASYANRTEGRPWPSTPEDHLEMRSRDKMKVSMMIRTVWDSMGAGAPCAVISDVDVQVFQDWTRVVRACTSDAHMCVTQQPGLYNERMHPFNSGFLAFRADMVSLAFVLNLAAQFEPQFLITDPEVLFQVYPIEQDVIAEYLFRQGNWFWAAFSPELVQIFVDYLPADIMKVKVQHACGSEAGDRLLSMFRVRRLYYSVLPLCLTGELQGPQHPCCQVYGFERNVFAPEIPRLRPFLRGSIYGQPRPFQALTLGVRDLHNRAAVNLPGTDDEQAQFWSWTCASERTQRMYDWVMEHPEADFMEGRIEPLPAGFKR